MFNKLNRLIDEGYSNVAITVKTGIPAFLVGVYRKFRDFTNHFKH